jgi:hypothetical protein
VAANMLKKSFGACIPTRTSFTVLPKAAPSLVPAGSPRWVTPDLIAETIRVWQPYYPKTLTPDDALSMIMNVGCLLDVLRE